MRIKRFLSGFLAVTLALSCINWRAASAQNVQTSNTTNSTYATEISDTNLEALTENSQILEHVDSEQFFDAEHIARLPEEETLDSYVFLNRDGSKSIYYMGQPVKYVDSNGVIQEKDTTLIRSNGGYCMRNNDIDLHIPDAVATGITVAYNNQTVKLTPQGGSGSAQQYDNSIVYYDYYGKGTILRYTPMLSGVKEDIILAKYTGQNSFTFLLETNGLQLYEDQGQYYLAENQDISAAFYLGQIAVYDAIGRPDLGTMTAETIIPGQKYRLTIAANESFLLDPETVYPVTIDPTVTVRDSADVSGTVEDAPVFSGYANRSFGDYVFNNIGYVDGYKLARTAFRLTSLLADSNYNQLSAEQLNSVSFHLKGSGGQFANLSLHALTENATWTESTLTWNNLGAYSETAYTTVRMGSSVWKTFDITALAKDWKTGAQNPDCGFVLISDSTTSSVSTFSAEYSTVDYRPYVVVNYTGTIALSQVSATLSVGGTLALTATTTPTGQVVSWASEDPTVAEVSEDGVVTALSLGTTTITASLEDGTSAECEVTVVAKSISLNYNTSDKIASVYKGETITLIATTEPAGEAVDWVSMNPEIATVANGVVTGISVGETKIRAYIDEYTFAECTVLVHGWSISLNQTSLIICKDSNETLIATIEPSDKVANWTSSDPTIATVTPSGTVTALKAGDAIITATLADGSSATCTIVVQISASLGTSFLQLEQYAHKQLSLDGMPENAEITWSSSNTDIVTVDSSGRITGHRAGYAYITADSKYLIEPTSRYIHVSLADGVYYIRGSGGFMIGASGHPDSGDHLYTYARQKVGNSQLYQLWYIEKLDCCWYVISPVCNPDLYMSISDGNVVLTPNRTYWNISYEANGYVIRSGNSYEYNIQVAAPGAYPGCSIYADNISTGSTLHYWHLENAEGMFLIDAETGTYTTDNTVITIEMGSTVDMDTLGLVTLEKGICGSDSTWSSSDNSVATVNPYTGGVSGHKRGKCTIKVTQTINNIAYSRSYTLQVIETVYVVNVYDMTMQGDSSYLRNYIGNAIAFLNIVFSDFNLRFVMDGEPFQNENDPIANCPKLDSAECYSYYYECTNHCPSHHKNVHKISDQLYTDYFDKNHVIVNWSNCKEGIYCGAGEVYDQNGELLTYKHIPQSSLALAVIDEEEPKGPNGVPPVAQIITITKRAYLDSANYSAEAYMAIVLAHEIAHTLGLKEVYENAYGDNSEHEGEDGMQCIMESTLSSTDRAGAIKELYMSVIDGDASALCDYCKNKLENYVPDDVYEEVDE